MKKSLRIVIVVYLILFVVEIVLILTRVSIDAAGNWNIGWILFYAQVFYTLASLRIVGPTEVGAKLLFGKPVEQAESGLTFVPWLIYNLRTDTKNVIELELPGEPETVQKFDEDNIQLGKVAPIRIVHASAESATGTDEEKNRLRDDPLHQRLVTEVSFIVRWKIKNYLDFISTIGTIAAANKQIEDMVILAAQNELAKETPAQVLMDLAKHNRQIRNALDYLVGENLKNPVDPTVRTKRRKPWGVDVIDASIKLVDTGRTVNTAIAAARAAASKKQEVIVAAEGVRQQKILDGQGVAEARLAFLTAEAAGQKKLAEVASTPEGKFASTLQSVKTASENANVIIAPDGLFSTIGAVGALLKKIDVLSSEEIPASTKEPPKP